MKHKIPLRTKDSGPGGEKALKIGLDRGEGRSRRFHALDVGNGDLTKGRGCEPT